MTTERLTTQRYSVESIRQGYVVWLTYHLVWATVTDPPIVGSAHVTISHDQGVSVYPAGTVLLTRKG